MSTSLQVVDQAIGLLPSIDLEYTDPAVATYLFDPVSSGVIPFDLDAMPPGSELAWVLANIDIDALNGHDRIVVLRAHDRMVSFHQSKRLEAMRSIHSAVSDEATIDRDEYIGEVASAEIQCALNLTRRAADIELSLALELARRIPRVLVMLADGSIDLPRARIIDRGTLHLSAAAARDVVDRIAASAPNMTTGQLAARIRKLCIDADADDATERYDRSVTGRMVVMEPTVDGTAHLSGLNLPPDRVTAIRRRINAIAKGLRGENDGRTMDQLRADVFLDLLQGHSLGTTGEGRSTVHLTTDLATLTGLADHAGDLDGYGPVISDIARQIATKHPDADWTFAVADPEHGHALHAGITRRRPTTAHQRQVRARHTTCVWPGCRMPSVDCDLDHTTRYADGGSTCPCNLAPLCRHHHMMRHTGFSYTVDAHDQVTWTSRLGHTYTTWRAPP